MINKCLPVLMSIVILYSCNKSYTGPGPKKLTCLDYPRTDTIESIRGIVKLIDTLAYISNYIDESTDRKLYPCNLHPNFKKNGFPITYSGFIKKNSGDSKEYIELSESTPIQNETIITNYFGLIRNRDSTLIPANEKNGIIKNFKVENHKIKLLLSYTGCEKGRKQYITLYKTTQVQGEIRTYGLITAPYESCISDYTLWYEIDAQFYKDHTFVLYDGVKTYEIYVPE